MPSLSPEQIAELRALLSTLKETVQYREFLNATEKAVRGKVVEILNNAKTE